MDKFKESITELESFLVEKVTIEKELENLRVELVDKKEPIQKNFIRLFDEVYYELKTNIGNQLRFSRIIEVDDYTDDLSATYKIGDYNFLIKFNLEDCELMEVIMEIEDELNETDDELVYEVTKYDSRWVWLNNREVLTKEMLLDHIKDIMMP